VRAVKGGRAPTRILSALILNDETARPHPEVRDILEGNGVLPLAIP
jgi:tRNA1(Val) A37 N6-methylase TrmN6